MMLTSSRCMRAGLWMGTVLALCASAPHLVRSAMAEGYPGFGLNASRVVLMAGDRASGATVALNNTDHVYLVQSRVYPADGATGWPLKNVKAGEAKGHASFLVTPPLQRVEARGRLPLRILPVPGNPLPADRESLFFLSVKAIPSDPPAAVSDQAAPRFSLALQQFVKLFYRPAGLAPQAISDGTVAPKLSVSREGDRVRVTNPTPYYVTFLVLKVAGKPVENSALRAMVPPQGTQTYPLPVGVTRGEVVWQLVDESGLATKTERRTLN
ncbi:fimbrial biogenesis chaperone [Enterobacter asburiae]|uniref:fimbrial biogenesis chaperone n=1 Tax=Enterobacter asburiae TaxID=61645 RepID=UPI003F572311